MHRSRRGDRSPGVRAIVLLAVLAGILLVGVARAQTAATTVGGPFTLVAPAGTTVSEDAYRGRWLLVYFGFTHCPSACPTALLQIAIALEQLGPLADRMQAIFITLDPARDTPAVMGDYTRSFDPRIVGLTGTPEQVAAVSREYGAYALPRRTGPGEDDYTIDHSTYLYLMDPEGRFVRGFDHEASGEHMAEVIRDFVTKREGGARIGARDRAGR